VLFGGSDVMADSEESQTHPFRFSQRYFDFLKLRIRATRANLIEAANEMVIWLKRCNFVTGFSSFESVRASSEGERWAKHLSIDAQRMIFEALVRDVIKVERCDRLIERGKGLSNWRKLALKDVELACLDRQNKVEEYLYLRPVHRSRGEALSILRSAAIHYLGDIRIRLGRPLSRPQRLLRKTRDQIRSLLLFLAENGEITTDNDFEYILKKVESSFASRLDSDELLSVSSMGWPCAIDLITSFQWNLKSGLEPFADVPNFSLLD
jgi:hypothetical protein